MQPDTTVFRFCRRHVKSAFKNWHNREPTTNELAWIEQAAQAHCDHLLANAFRRSAETEAQKAAATQVIDRAGRRLNQALAEIGLLIRQRQTTPNIYHPSQN